LFSFKAFLVEKLTDQQKSAIRGAIAHVTNKSARGQVARSFNKLVYSSNTEHPYDRLKNDARKMSHPQFIAKHSIEHIQDQHGKAFEHTKHSPKHPNDRIKLSHLDPSEYDDWHQAKDELYHKGIPGNSAEYTAKKRQHIDRLRSEIKSGTKHRVLVTGRSDHPKYRPQVADGHHRMVATHLEKQHSTDVYYDKPTLTDIWKHHNKK